MHTVFCLSLSFLFFWLSQIFVCEEFSMIKMQTSSTILSWMQPQRQPVTDAHYSVASRASCVMRLNFCFDSTILSPCTWERRDGQQRMNMHSGRHILIQFQSLNFPYLSFMLFLSLSFSFFLEHTESTTINFIILLLFSALHRIAYWIDDITQQYWSLPCCYIVIHHTHSFFFTCMSHCGRAYDSRQLAHIPRERLQ